MPSSLTLKASGVRAQSLLKKVEQAIEEGFHDVVLDYGDDADPRQVLKCLQLTLGQHKVVAVIRHAEMKEYLANAIAGTACGIAVATATTLLAAISAGMPVSLPLVLAAAGLGGLVGLLVAGGGTPISRVIVYKYRGHTRIKMAVA